MTPIDAVSIAARLHGLQVDKLNEPYLGHLVRVMLRLPPEANDMERCAAVLHDVGEDVVNGMERLREMGVDPAVVNLVSILTRRTYEPYDAYVDRLKDHPSARMIKLADVADNSDPDRLARLPSGVRTRLQAKYSRAMALLRSV